MYMLYVRKSHSICEPMLMEKVSYTELRARLAHYLDEATDSLSTVRVTRKGRPEVVVVDAAEYDGMVETLHLLRSPANAKHLAKSLKEAAGGSFVEVKEFRKK
tara:strand:- start:61786 stop:62094 length:309 start_codon:yes stop_codon:yes gene_type:complete